jgi:hypothetical protein
MRTIVVRYETKPDRADENQQLIERVFAVNPTTSGTRASGSRTG